MEHISAANVLVAKTNSRTSESKSNKFLPLNIHLKDTASVIIYLATEWLPDSARLAMADGLSEDELVRVCIFIALVHDLGKATPAFQNKVEKFVDGARDRLNALGLIWDGSKVYHDKSPHALAGEELLLNEGCPPNIAAIVGAHHGKPTEMYKIDDQNSPLTHIPSNYYGESKKHSETYKNWKSAHREIIEYALEQAGYASIDDLPHLSIISQLLIAGLQVMADWLASNTSYFPLIDVNEVNCIDIGARAERALAKIHLPECWQPEMLFSSEGLCERRFTDEHGVGFTPNAVQRAMMDVAERAKKPGIIILEAQMGVGKTEAALLAAELLSCGMNGQPRRGGIFFGLPTQATSNAIFSRIDRWAQSLTEYSQASIRLAHGGALLNDEFTDIMERSQLDDEQDAGGLMVHEWFMGRKRELLSTFVIGTVDQLLMAALKQKHVMLRQLGLCGKVVILDEVHAYDAYMSQYLESELRWLGAMGVPVILLSATLPPARRSKLIKAYLGDAGSKASGEWESSTGYPLLTWTDGGKVDQRTIADYSPSRRVIISRAQFAPDDMKALGELLYKELEDGGCAGIIVNTVKRAQQIAEELSKVMPDVLILHSQYQMTDRTKHEAELLRRAGKLSDKAQRDGLIVIGTQVIEQSLDIDFDIMITDLCPMDLLLQRIGRLHRHWQHDAIRPDRLKQARCIVLGALGDVEPGGKAVYGEYLLMRTNALLPDEITLPGDIPLLVRDVYDENVRVDVDAERYNGAKKDYDILCKNRAQRAKTFSLNLPHERDECMVGLMDNDLQTNSRLANDQSAQAAVRDGEPSIDVILMRQKGDKIVFADGTDGEFSPNHVPDNESCKEISRRKLRLPHVLCSPWRRAESTISELEDRNEIIRKEWWQSPWLHGELILLLDEHNSAELCGYRLHYDGQMGLKCTKEDADE